MELRLVSPTFADSFSLPEVGLEFSIFSSLTLATADARAIRSTPKRRREKVAPTPAATYAELIVVVFCRDVLQLRCTLERKRKSERGARKSEDRRTKNRAGRVFQ